MVEAAAVEVMAVVAVVEATIVAMVDKEVEEHQVPPHGEELVTHPEMVVDHQDLHIHQEVVPDHHLDHRTTTHQRTVSHRRSHSRSSQT